MKRLLFQYLIAAVVAIVAWWPLAERDLRLGWWASHVLIPAGIAAAALLVFRMLRSLLVAVLFGLAAAAIALLLLRHYGDQLRPLLMKVLP